MKTKNLILSLILALTLTSCSMYYYQVSTMSSNDARVTDDGQFVQNNEDITLYFDFWAENGKVSFTVVNNSSSDITLDLSRSFFVENGFARDYFLNRTMVYSKGSTSSRGRSASSSRSSVATEAKAVNSRFEAPFEYLFDFGSSGGVISTAHSSSESTSISGSVVNVYSTHSGYSVEYKEGDRVTIPAKSAKQFGEYAVVSGEFVKCGLIRNPRGHEKAMVKFDMSNSPIVIENRLMFEVDGKEMPINSMFYVSELQNLRKKSVLKPFVYKNCYGKIKGRRLVNVIASSDKYYVKYNILDGETGRVN